MSSRHRTDREFPAVLKWHQKAAGLTQRQLGAAAGIRPNMLSKYQCGKARPPESTRDRIAQVLGLVGDDLEEYLAAWEHDAGIRILSSLHNIPSRRNPFFTGRAELIEQLHRRLAPGSQVAFPQAISGLGGIGKTQVALEYAYRYQKDYSHVLWVTADSRDNLTAEFGHFARDLDLPEKNDKDQNRVVAAVRRWLREYVNWLLILDNVEDLSLVTSIIPPGGLGAVLLTTRLQVTEPVALALELESMPEEEGALLLLRRTKHLAPNSSLDAAPSNERLQAEEISRALGGLPLALDQAAAYILETRSALSDYLRLYASQQAALLARRSSVPSDHPESVTRTFALNFTRAQEKSQPPSRCCNCVRSSPLTPFPKPSSRKGRHI